MKPIQCEVINHQTGERCCTEIAVRYFVTNGGMKTCARCVKHAEMFDPMVRLTSMYREIRRREFEAIAAVKEVSEI